MPTMDPIRHQKATVEFKRGMKASRAGIHRTLNRAPKGKGWVRCSGAFEGIFYRPEKVQESIAFFKAAYEIFPDIVSLNQIALAYELPGEIQEASACFRRMQEQAEREDNAAYTNAAELGLRRIG